jgi:hypothetical protein
MGHKLGHMIEATSVPLHSKTYNISVKEKHKDKCALSCLDVNFTQKCNSLFHPSGLPAKIFGTALCEYISILQEKIEPQKSTQNMGTSFQFCTENISTHNLLQLQSTPYTSDEASGCSASAASRILSASHTYNIRVKRHILLSQFEPKFHQIKEHES